MTGSNTVLDAADGGCEIMLKDGGTSSKLAHNDKIDGTSSSGEVQEEKAADEPRHVAFETRDQDEKLSESLTEKRDRTDADQEQTGFQPGGRNYWFTQLIKSSQMRKKKGDSQEKGDSKEKGGSKEKGVSVLKGLSKEASVSKETSASKEKGGSKQKGSSKEKGVSKEKGGSKEKGSSKPKSGSKEAVLGSDNAVGYAPREQALVADTPEGRVVQNIETSSPEKKTDDATPSNLSPSAEPSNGSTALVVAEEPPPSLEDAFNMAHGEASRLMAGTVATFAGTVATLEATGKSVKDASDAFRDSPAVQSFITSTSANLESAGKTIAVVMEPVTDEAANLIVCPAQAIIELLEPVESEFASRVRAMVCGAAKLEGSSRGSPPTSHPVDHVTVATSAEVRSVNSMTSMARSKSPSLGVFQAGGNVRCATPLIPLRSPKRGVRGKGKVRSAAPSPPPKAAKLPRRSWTSASRAGFRKPPAKTASTGKGFLNPNDVPREEKPTLPVQ